MALPILDGNQTSTTLATTISGGAHYPNHIIADAVTVGSLPDGIIFGQGIAEGYDNYGGAPVQIVSSVNLPVSGSVTIGNSITIGSCVTHGVTIANTSVTIGGSVTANLPYVSAQPASQTEALPVVLITDEGKSVFDVNQSIKATLYNALPAGTNRIGVVTIGAGSVTIGAGTAQIGSVTASISGTPSVTFTAITGSTSIIGTPAVTFTAIVLPSGSLTTRFGSVTTANTVVASTAVTNTSRRYLFVQNNQTGTSANVATIGIGFTPTTTQGIQLTAGASYVADSFVPTGAVYWLGSVTGAVFTIVEG